MLTFLPVLWALGGQAVPLPPPPPPPRAVQAAPAPPPKAYSADADAKEKIAAAIEMAATDQIRVLVAWGANDDALSMSFADARKTPEMARSTFFSDEYKLVTVDVGRADKNVALAASYGVTLKADALPALTVLDDHGRPVAQAPAAALMAADRRSIDAGKVAAFLKANQAPAPDTLAPFNAAIAEAKKTGKYVFMWFSAPW
jgi:hypothetical protein